MSKISITYQVNEFTSIVECTSANEKVFIDEGYGLSIICPDPAHFCQRSGVLNCKNDCSGVGVCKKDKRCFCDILYEGDDCSKFIPCKDSLCEELIQAQSSVDVFVMLLVSLYMNLFLF